LTDDSRLLRRYWPISSVSQTQPMVQHALSKFPRLAFAVNEVLRAAQVRERGVRTLFIYGGYVRRCFGFGEALADVDIAAGSSADRLRLRLLNGQRVIIRDARSGMLAAAKLDCNPSVFRDPMHLLHHLEDFTIMGMVYSLENNSVHANSATLEHLADGFLRLGSPSAATPLRTVCRVHKMLRRGFRTSQNELLEAIRRYRGRTLFRRWAERRWMELRFGKDYLVDTR
jgi:hypothetical protein